MPRSMRFLLLLLGGLALLSIAATWIAQRTMRRWFITDLTLRAQLAYSGVRPALIDRWDEPKPLHALLTELSHDERLLAAAACDTGGHLIAVTDGYPAQLGCTPAGRTRELLHSGSGVHVNTFTLVRGDRPLGAVHFLHNLAHVDERIGAARRFMLLCFAVLAGLASLFTVLLARLTWREWIEELQKVLRGQGTPTGSVISPLVDGHLRELDRRLPSAAAAYAKRLLGLYLAFKTALVELEQRPESAGNGVAALRARLLGMQQLRAQYFDEREAQGMFGFDDAYDQDAISRLEISQDSALTPAQKQQALAALDVARSAELRDAHDAPMAVVHLEETAARMRQSGASDDEIYRMRAAAFDPQAASRLADVDRDEALWKARIQAYLAARDQLLLANAREPEAVRAEVLAGHDERINRLAV